VHNSVFHEPVSTLILPVAKIFFMRILITNIGSLVQVETQHPRKTRIAGADMAHLPAIDHAWLLIEDEWIADFGTMDSLPAGLSADTHLAADGRLVLPAWCDSHTHLVFAAPREQEFVDRIQGLSYAQIAARGGGILNSAAQLRAADETLLYEQSMARLHQVIASGTGAIEIKSGYGLSTEAELKMLRIIRKIKENAPIPVKASFLAAHANPPEYKDNPEGYLRLIMEEMLPRVAHEGLADYMDVFCETGFFDQEATARLLEAGWKYGLKPKIHANQLHLSGGVQVGVQHRAVSVDHLEHISDAEIEVLKHSSTMPTLLPGAAFFLNMRYQPARMLIDNGLPVCLATDYNPGSCPSGNVPLLLTIACTQLRMTPEEAIHAATLNGAAALESEQTLGSIATGKKANLIITKPMSSVAYIPYDYGNNPVEKMILKGKFF
jgi:imidazolonepropionase